MKIAIVGPFHANIGFGGVENHVHYLSEYLEREGVEIERHSWKIRKDEANLKAVSLFNLQKCFEQTNADIVHLHSSAITASLLCSFSNPKNMVAATIHAFYHPEFETTFKMKLISILMKAPYINALKRLQNITTSRFMRGESEQYGIQIKAVIPNGIASDSIRSTKTRKEYESDVVMVGRFTEQKGVYDFINAFSNSGLKAVLLGYGESYVEQEIRKLCEKNRIKCICRPDRDTILQYIKSSHIYALPSKYEPFGIVGLEAMALEKPIVVYRVAGGPIDFVEHNVNGLIIENNPYALKKAVISLINDTKKLSQMSKKALETSKEYNWPNIAKKTKDFYSSLLLK